MPDFLAHKINSEAAKPYLKLVPHHLKAKSTRTIYLIKLKKMAESKNMKKACKAIRKAIKAK